MYTIEHEFYPSDEVFVVIDETRIEKSKVIQVEAKVYEKEEEFVELLEYLVLLEDNLNTKIIEPDQIFSTVEEALDKVKEVFEPSVT